MNGFCLKQVQGLKALVACLHPNCPQMAAARHIATAMYLIDRFSQLLRCEVT